MENGFEKALEVIKKALDQYVGDYNATDKVQVLVDVYADVTEAYIKALKEGETNE